MKLTTAHLQALMNQNRILPIGDYKEFAVLLPLFQRQGQWYILFEKRSKHISQPGEVSLPGGAIEQEETPWEAAIRETHEEIGIIPERIAYVGTWNPLVTHFGYYIHVLIGEIGDFDERRFVPNQEVDEIFSVPLSFLLREEPARYEARVTVRQPEDFPFSLLPDGGKYAFREEIRATDFWEYDDYVIWGLTARIVRDFIEQLKEEFNDYTT